MASKAEKLSSQFLPLTAKDITSQSLPELSVVGGYHTTSIALHDIYFTGNLELWHSFEQEVISFRSIIEHKWTSTVLGYYPSDSTYHSIFTYEYYRCGEEISVSGRFVSHALQVMSGVAKEVGFTNVFGDWKATGRRNDSSEEKDRSKMPDTEERVPAPNDKEGGSTRITERNSAKKGALIPDYALLSAENCSPRAIGEAKTPWKHKIFQWWGGFVSDILPLRHSLGMRYF